ncbi:PD-(D/E)XK nuclease family protein [Aliivibrio sifiae]|uniref:PD-(D/E)XK nuclease superfamily protein n=1 Tax=Aliivibrio sifiae TaxID=566293 RepID=A0A2S7XIY5_9GAMM|nr:PD-(D/E)XK nuclease family protein [Aliivibrio sifiae]PQJ93352.1 hypothetical protein BTO23_04465 [Aliivibrio sifiae]GLR74567.1 hypothetical protein GCM10007855_14410 [Aliivibrio sifiae]
METQLQRIETLIENIKNLPKSESAESTIFSIGSKGYYENPTTDILAFFIDDNAEHGLGALVLEALVETLPENIRKLDCSLSSTPEREVVTKAGKRIDLLLEGQQWVMVVENKIFHEQNNPFQEYEDFVFTQHPERFTEKDPIFIVLSPSGSVPSKYPTWIGISYPSLVASIKQKLSDYFISQPLNKWVVLLREFILHLENMMSTDRTSEESINFILNNLTQIKEAQDLKIKTIKSYQKNLLQALQTELEIELNSTIVHWNGFPAIRFAYVNWPTDSDVVLFFDGRDRKSFCFNYYASDINTDAQRAIADAHFKELDCGNPWNEVRDTCRCYKAHFEGLSSGELCLQTIQAKMAHKLRLMNTFEWQIRPTLNQ